MSRVLGNFIDGETAAHDGHLMDLVDPSTEQVFATAATSSEQEIDAACAAAARSVRMQLSHVGGMVQRTPNHARVVTGGSRARDRGYFFEPTVIDGLQQEGAGPLEGLMRVRG